MKKIPLVNSKARYVIVDDEDFPYLSRFSWYLSMKTKKSGRVNPVAQAYLGMSGLQTKAVVEMTRLLVPMKEARKTKKRMYEVFHLNKNSLDNRKSNLKLLDLASIRTNNRKRRDTASIYKGVWWQKHNKIWCAQIIKNGKRYRLGSFGVEADAGRAYNKKAKELYGNMAYQNFIKD